MNKVITNNFFNGRKAEMKPGTEIIVKHPNGYSGMMYGESSLTVFDSHMRKVLHTGSRNVKTAEELYTTLELMPGFMSLIEKIDELKEDAEDDNI